MSSTPSAAEGELERLDADSPAATMRGRFALPDGVVYLDGHSLGPLPAAAPQRVEHLLRREWGEGLVLSWERAGWWELPLRLGSLVAPLVGADADEVAVTDSISVNLFKLLSAAAGLRGERRVLLVERDAFPTDRYLASSVASLLGLELREVESAWSRWCRRAPEAARSDAGAGRGAGRGGVGGGGREAHAGSPTAPALEDALDDSVAAVLLAHVDYRSSHRYDLAETTALVHSRGALVVWDLAHSAGAVPVALDAAGADFAVGCTYKYLNGGPGAPAFLYAARRHLESARQPLSGWHGHADAFSFLPDYEPSPGIRRFLTGSPPLVAYAALEAALELWGEVDLGALERARRSLGELLVALVAERCPSLELASPADPDRRGSHVAFRHPDAGRLVEALAGRGVLADARRPDLVRMALTPLYLRHVDVAAAVAVLEQVLKEMPA